MDYQKVNEIKCLVSQRYSVTLHFHDTCGSGMYFSLDSANPEIEQFLREYFAAIGKTVTTSANGKNFTVE